MILILQIFSALSYNQHLHLLEVHFNLALMIGERSASGVDS